MSMELLIIIIINCSILLDQLLYLENQYFIEFRQAIQNVKVSIRHKHKYNVHDNIYFNRFETYT